MSTESRRIRVLLADDHAVTREGLQVILERSEEFEVVGQARDGVEAVKAASELSPDLIVMDVMMPKKDGVEACREIMESLPETRVIMLTASTEANAVIEAVAAGATGYLQKVVGMDQVLGMMKSAAAGEGRLPTEVVRRVFDRIRSRAKSKEEVDLTQREKEILVSFCRGMSYVAIAEAREVKVVTIRNAIYTIQVKLGVASKQEVVVWAVRNGLLDDCPRGRLTKESRGAGARHGEEPPPQARRGQGESRVHHGESQEPKTIGAPAPCLNRCWPTSNGEMRSEIGCRTPTSPSSPAPSAIRAGM